MKSISLLILCAFIAGVGYLYSQGSDEAPIEYRTVAIARGDIVSTITASGTIEPVEVVDVGAQIVGRIKSFADDPNSPGKTIDFVSKVTAGAVIASIDDLPYVAALERAQSDLKLAEAEQVRAQTKSDQAARDLKRAELAKDVNSESEYEAYQTASSIAESEVAIAIAKVEQAKVLVKQAEINLDYTLIRSPIDGVILDRRVNVGQTVVAGLNAPSLFLIAKDLKHMRVWAAINEADIGQVFIDQNVSFNVDAYPDDTFTGKVSQIRLNASTANSVVTYGVIVDIDNSDGRLLPYMTANLEFNVAKRESALLVPNQALRWNPTASDTNANDSNDASNKLWQRSEAGSITSRDVATGISDGLNTELTSDTLKEGDLVIIGTIKQKRPDFVSSFVSRVTKPKD
jgi:HlyD family secretion protein